MRLRCTVIAKTVLLKEKKNNPVKSNLIKYSVHFKYNGLYYITNHWRCIV
ncbi:hypothetical protein SAMN02745136_00611 [Anaerocolumna jejuensis DSM 15929]|uniref:Uncharacterized protein n=1 Tax=Anaerocolumna jejuensis DSM 15929 TaxID=1121322 RepID=A0A1M6KX13_9FIRM|nr:hypothetical protein SAMN02745136_00611 [Anaerocolumna jejuensis DSM 15929]